MYKIKMTGLVGYVMVFGITLMPGASIYLSHEETWIRQVRPDESCPRVNFYRHAFHRRNQTCLPGDYNLNLFEKYGYKDTNIPHSLNHYKPLLLHESSVIRYIDDKGNFMYLGNGTYGNVYLGELKETGKRIVMKQFTEGTTLRDMDLEARILMYLENTGVFPKFYGYVPCGTHVNNISMVMEYLPNSETMEEIEEREAITVYQWLLIFEQTTLALKTMHSKFILHNDLHMNNILIMWNDTNPIVRLIDTGFATFREGKMNSFSTDKVHKYPIFPPDAADTESNPSMDIYAMGHAVTSINNLLKNSDIGDLGEYCRQIIPEHRPTADQVLFMITQLKKKYSAQLGMGFKLQMHGGELSSERYQKYVSAPLPMILLDELSKPPPPDQSDQYLAFYSDYRSYLGYYKEKVVIIRLSMEREFRKIRKEAALTKFASSLGITPAVFGLAFHGSTMSEVGFVQEYLYDSLTLADAFKTQRSNWSDEFRLKLGCKLVRAVGLLHEEHILINDLTSSHVLFKSNGSEPMVFLESLGVCSDSNGVFLNHSSFYNAPETKAETATSFSSDVYSLGRILQLIFHNTNNTAVMDTVQTCVQSKAEVRPSVQKLYLSMCGETMKPRCRDEL